MKKAIWAAVLAAIVSIFAISCSKSSMNSSKLVGSWKLVSTTVTSGSYSETEIETSNIVVNFVKGGTLTLTTTSGSKTLTVAGTWNVVDDALYIIVDDDAYSYIITEINNKSMILSRTKTISGEIYTYSENYTKL